MTNEELLKTIRDLQRSNPNYKQTTVYPHISEDSLNLIKSEFPEYDPLEEMPLVFCKCYSEAYTQPRWIFISNKRFYYKIAISPPNLTALDCIALQNIHSMSIRCRWVLNYVELNEKPIGTIIISSLRETLFLKKVIKVILNSSNSKDLDVRNSPRLSYYPLNDWRHLPNAGLFSLVDEYFKKNNPGGRNWGFQFFYTHPFIKPEKMEMARQEYADYDLSDAIPLLFVENVGDRIAGIVITNKYLYYNLGLSLMREETKNKIALQNINSFRIKSRYFGWIFINNKRIGFTNAFDFFDRKAARVFEDLVNLIIQEVKKKNLEYNKK